SIAVLMVMLLVIMPIPALLAFSYFGLVSYGLQHMLRKKNREQGVIVVEANRGATNATLDAIEGFREIRMHNVTDRYL
ncbi:hypothetical protein B9K02_12575, partial [Lentilactobacillus kefiri]